MKEELTKSEWNPDSWKNLKISQQPEYNDLEKLEQTINKVKISNFLIIFRFQNYHQ